MSTRVGYVGTESIGNVLTKANFDKLPGGLVGYSTNSTNGAAITGTNTMQNITGLSLTPSFSSSRMISIYVGCAAYSIQSAAVAADLCVNDVTGSACLGSMLATTTGQGFGVGVPGGSVTALATPAAGSHTYAGAMIINGGLGTCQPQGAAANGLSGSRSNIILIRDEGPSF